MKYLKYLKYLNFFLITLLIIIVVYCLLKNNTKKIQLETNNKFKKIAVFTYNFGNFRDELTTQKIDNFKQFNEFDYYLYTDQNIKSDKWNVIKVPLRPRTPHMNANRVTSKYYKWKIIPKELKNYDYILHIDCAKINWLNNITPKNMYDIINKYPNVIFFGRKQPVHKNIYEEASSKWHRGEVDDTEYGENADKWIKKLKQENFKQKFTHCETGLHLKKNTKKINNILSKVYDELMINKLCRDQHVFPYVLQKNNLNINEYKIIDDFSF